MTQATLEFETPPKRTKRERKRDLLLKVLQTGRRMSKGEIWRELGIWNSGHEIMCLRREGHSEITTEMVTRNDNTFAEYFIPKSWIPADKQRLDK